MKSNITNIEYYKKRYRFLFNKKTLVAVVLIFLILIFVLNYVYEIPEFELSQKYLETNKVVQEYFGDIISIRKGESGSHVGWNLTGTNRVEGNYSFLVKGNKKET